MKIQLAFREPFDWERLLAFLQARAMKGVESVSDGAYRRTVRAGPHTGWLEVRRARGCELHAELSDSLAPARSTIDTRLRLLFDLDANPDVISAHLAQHALLADTIARRPGLRVPGAFDTFEIATRAILGQQVTVKAATTIAGRFAAAFGEPIDTPHAALTHLSPSAARVAALDAEEVARVGIIRTRARSIVAIAEEMASGRLSLEPGAPPETAIEQLTALPGIGAWTAAYIAMRALPWNDAFPRGDVALRNALGGVSAARAEELSLQWSPWRSYATLHLWFEAGERERIAECTR